MDVDVPLGKVVPAVEGGTAAVADVEVREMVVDVADEVVDPQAATKSPAPTNPARYRTDQRDGGGRC